MGAIQTYAMVAAIVFQGNTRYALKFSSDIGVLFQECVACIQTLQG